MLDDPPLPGPRGVVQSLGKVIWGEQGTTRCARPLVARLPACSSAGLPCLPAVLQPPRPLSSPALLVRALHRRQPPGGGGGLRGHDASVVFVARATAHHAAVQCGDGQVRWGGGSTAGTLSGSCCSARAPLACWAVAGQCRAPVLPHRLLAAHLVRLLPLSCSPQGQRLAVPHPAAEPPAHAATHTDLPLPHAPCHPGAARWVSAGGAEQRRGARSMLGWASSWQAQAGDAAAHAPHLSR